MGKHELTYVALYLFLFCPDPLKAQDKLLSYFHFEHLTAANGVPAKEVPASKVVPSSYSSRFLGTSLVAPAHLVTRELFAFLPLSESRYLWNTQHCKQVSALKQTGMLFLVMKVN